jgi:carboxyl-terminal processing protease
MSSRTRLLVLLVSTPVVAFALIGGFLGKAGAQDARQPLSVFRDVIHLVLNNYVEEVAFDSVMQGAMRGLAEGLDPDSAYLRPEEVTLMETGDPGPPGTVGLELTRQYYLRVIAARDGSPAARGGLRTGDYVRAIDGGSTRDMTVFQGMRALRGPVGSKVSLTIIRGNAAEPHVVDLVREKIEGGALDGRLLDDGVGYIRIAAFDQETPAQLEREIAAARRAGADRLAIDLRGTAEGPLDAGIAASRLFVDSGTLARLEARGEPVETIAAADGDGRITLPVALLVNTGTSGAAEVFAAALDGNGRAELIGNRTLGRAARQKLVRLPDGSALWMTWARFTTPAGDPLHGRGLEPAIEVDEPDLDFGAPRPEKDPVLDRAIEHLTAAKAA